MARTRLRHETFTVRVNPPTSPCPIHSAHVETISRGNFPRVNSERYSDIASIYSHNAVSEAMPTVAEASEATPAVAEASEATCFI